MPDQIDELYNLYVAHQSTVPVQPLSRYDFSRYWDSQDEQSRDRLQSKWRGDPPRSTKPYVDYLMWMEWSDREFRRVNQTAASVETISKHSQTMDEDEFFRWWELLSADDQAQWQAHYENPGETFPPPQMDKIVELNRQHRSREECSANLPLEPPSGTRYAQ